jgi:hypothetical protein
LHDANNGTNRFVSGFSRTQRREKTVERPVAASVLARSQGPAIQKKKKRTKQKKKKKEKKK